MRRLCEDRVKVGANLPFLHICFAPLDISDLYQWIMTFMLL